MDLEVEGDDDSEQVDNDHALIEQLYNALIQEFMQAEAVRSSGPPALRQRPAPAAAVSQSVYRFWLLIAASLAMLTMAVTLWVLLA